MKLLTLSISGGGTNYTISVPSQLQAVSSYNLQSLLSFAINTLLTVSILLSFFFVLIGGLKWMFSQGDKKQVEEAQKTIMYAVIGLIVVLLSFFIINLLGVAFGVTLLGK